MDYATPWARAGARGGKCLQGFGGGRADAGAAQALDHVVEQGAEQVEVARQPVGTPANDRHHLPRVAQGGGKWVAGSGRGARSGGRFWPGSGEVETERSHR